MYKDTVRTDVKFLQKWGFRMGNTTGHDYRRDKTNIPSIPICLVGPYYRILSGHMEFGAENSPVQEIANDLNVGAVRKDRKSHGPSCDGWSLASL